VARKRERVDLSETEHLFKQRLNALLGEAPRPRNAALDTLVGASPQAVPQQDEEHARPGVASTPPVQTRRRRETNHHRRSASSSPYVGRTVYLQAEDLREIDALAEEWSAAANRHISRSEVLRQAVRWLRGTAAPPPLDDGE
jgi:hypothetical protein